jgi:transposase
MALEHGRAVAGKPGGDQRSSKTDAHAALIMAMLEENGDITLAEIRTGLAERGIAVGIGTLWRFFNRHKVTRKKSRATRSSRTARTS